MWDNLRIALWAGGLAVAVATVCLMCLASQNLGSRNIVLATGTFIAAVILLVTQLCFELRSVEFSDFITAEFTIDRAKPGIRQWKYGANQGQRLTRDMDGSDTFAVANPGQFDGDREKLTHDMVIFSLLAYLATEQFDWQMQRTQFVGQSMGTMTVTAPGSKPDECTVITTDRLRTMLLSAGNSFANGGVFFIRQSLCLPPHSTLQVKGDGLTLTNPFCEISFSLEKSGMTLFGRPGANGREQVPLPNGEAQFETRATGIRATTLCSAVRSQHLDMPRYQEWSKKVVGGAQRWFMDNGG